MAHSFTNLLYHIVFATKERREWLAPTVRDATWEYIGGVIRADGGIALVINGMSEHVHILAKLPASKAVSDIVRAVKAKSSHRLRVKLDAPEFAWQTGYGAFSVSQSQIDVVRRYIQTQEEHHRTMSFTDEMRKLVRAHGLEVDEQLLWE
jgi:putative transposase